MASRRLSLWQQATAIDAPWPQRLANGLIALCQQENTRKFIDSVGEAPNYITPVAYTDKVQCRKLFDRDPRWIAFNDKLMAREHALQRCPELKAAKLLWQGKDPEALPLADLEPPFVIKPNHRSGAVITIRQRADISEVEIRSLCRDWLASTYGQLHREWGYRHVEPRLFVEELLPPASENALYPDDLKAMVMNGRVVHFKHMRKTAEAATSTFFDRDWNRLPLKRWLGWTQPAKRALPTLENVPRPASLASATDCAEKIARGCDSLRVDFYLVGDELYFGELIVYEGAGFVFGYDEHENFASYPSRHHDFELGAMWPQHESPLWRKLLMAATYR